MTPQRSLDAAPKTPDAGVGTLDYLIQAVDGAPGFGPTLTRGFLRGCSWLHGIGLEIDLFMYRLGLARVTRLPVEVVSVGNLSMGGTGKTLAVQRLARELAATGRQVAILSRGYRRKSADAVMVVSTPHGVCGIPRECGDEPCLLAHSLPGVPVLVGKNRRVTGRYAVEHFDIDTLLLDDGFQYWRLYKDREIVLLDALQPSTRDHLLPRGFFREPWSHLRRAQDVWITHAALGAPSRVAQLAARVRRHAPHAQLRYTEHMPTCLRTADGTAQSLERLRGQRVLALSGLGNPQQFETMLANLGAEVTPCRYPDHHPYSADDFAVIAGKLDANQLLITTAKDAIRFPRDMEFPYLVVEAELCDVPAPQAEK